MRPIKAGSSIFDNFSQLFNLDRAVVNFRLVDCLFESYAKTSILAQEAAHVIKIPSEGLVLGTPISNIKPLSALPRVEV